MSSALLQGGPFLIVHHGGLHVHPIGERLRGLRVPELVELEPLDPAISGVALFIVAMIVAFVVLGYLIFAIGKILGRVANRK